MPKSKTKEGISEDTKAIVVALLLIFVYPIGLMLAWFWVKWNLWVKILLTIPFVFFAIVLSTIISTAISKANPGRQLDKVECRMTCQRISEQDNQQRCFDACEAGKVFIK